MILYPGQKVRLSEYGGYDYERLSAEKVLEDGVYTVHSVLDTGWKTHVYLEEFGDSKRFNSVLLEAIDEDPDFHKSN
mgnify:CR=1 FL=1|tara:strand:+ start:189 stop:419 length:231 start_codon:yes stop_codon:yes gene_type:complete